MIAGATVVFWRWSILTDKLKLAAILAPRLCVRSSPHEPSSGGVARLK